MCNRILHENFIIKWITFNICDDDAMKWSLTLVYLHCDCEMLVISDDVDDGMVKGDDNYHDVMGNYQVCTNTTHTLTS